LRVFLVVLKAKSVRNEPLYINLYFFER